MYFIVELVTPGCLNTLDRRGHLGAQSVCVKLRGGVLGDSNWVVEIDPTLFVNVWSSFSKALLSDS